MGVEDGRMILQCCVGNRQIVGEVAIFCVLLDADCGEFGDDDRR